MPAKSNRRELAIRCAVAALGGGVGLAGPDAAAAATALTPLLESGLARVYETLSDRRQNNAAETLLDAADEAGASTDEEFLEFVDSALSDSRRQELLARVLIVAQDTAHRDKRRALGRALAAGVADDGHGAYEELFFVRVLDDLDAPHLHLLRTMQEYPRHISVSPGTLRGQLRFTDANYGIPDHALLPPLERHGLIVSTGEEYIDKYNFLMRQYRITPNGQWLLGRLADQQ